MPCIAAAAKTWSMLTRACSLNTPQEVCVPAGSKSNARKTRIALTPFEAWYSICRRISSRESQKPADM